MTKCEWNHTIEINAHFFTVASDHFVSTEYQPSHDQDSLASWLLTSVINMLVLLPPVSTSTW